MKRPTTRHAFLGILAALAGAGSLPLATSAHESPIDHVSRVLQLTVQRKDAVDHLMISYRIVLSERAALLQLRAMDANQDAKISDAERAEYLDKLAVDISRQMQMTVDETAVPVAVAGSCQLDAEFGQTFTFSVPLPRLTSGVHTAQLLDMYSRNFPGPYVLRASRPGTTTQPAISPVELSISGIGGETPTTAPALRHDKPHESMIAVKLKLTVP